MKTADQVITYIKLAASRGEHRKVLEAWDGLTTTKYSPEKDAYISEYDLDVMRKVHKVCRQKIMHALANVSDDYFTDADKKHEDMKRKALRRGN